LRFFTAAAFELEDAAGVRAGRQITVTQRGRKARLIPNCRGNLRASVVLRLMQATGDHWTDVRGDANPHRAMPSSGTHGVAAGPVKFC